MSLSSIVLETLFTLVFAIGVLGALLRFSRLIPTFSKGLKYYSLLGFAAFLTLYAHSANLIEHSIKYDKNSPEYLSSSFKKSIQILSISREDNGNEQKSNFPFIENDEEDNLLSLKKFIQKRTFFTDIELSMAGVSPFRISVCMAHSDYSPIVHGTDRYLSFIQVFRI